MTRRSRGQSIVEMAFILPVLLVVIFGIMEFGYYIYAYSTLSQATRNGAEMAAQLPPYESWLETQDAGGPGGGVGFEQDRCVNAIYTAIRSDATLFSDIVDDNVAISYPNGGDTRNLRDRGPIEITVTYSVQGITPLYQLLGLDGAITMRVTQRRSIENLGVDPTQPRTIACAKDLEDYLDLHGAN